MTAQLCFCFFNFILVRETLIFALTGGDLDFECVYVTVCADVPMCGGQRTAPGVTAQALPVMFSETGSPLGLELMKCSEAGQCGPGICHLLSSPALEYKCISDAQLLYISSGYHT